MMTFDDSLGSIFVGIENGRTIIILLLIEISYNNSLRNFKIIAFHFLHVVLADAHFKAFELVVLHIWVLLS